MQYICCVTWFHLEDTEIPLNEGMGRQAISVISTANLIFHILTIYTIRAIQQVSVEWVYSKWPLELMISTKLFLRYWFHTASQFVLYVKQNECKWIQVVGETLLFLIIWFLQWTTWKAFSTYLALSLVFQLSAKRNWFGKPFSDLGWSFSVDWARLCLEMMPLHLLTLK